MEEFWGCNFSLSVTGVQGKVHNPRQEVIWGEKTHKDKMMVLYTQHLLKLSKVLICKFLTYIFHISTCMSVFPMPCPLMGTLYSFLCSATPSLCTVSCLPALSLLCSSSLLIHPTVGLLLTLSPSTLLSHTLLRKSSSSVLVTCLESTPSAKLRPFSHYKMQLLSTFISYCNLVSERVKFTGFQYCIILQMNPTVQQVIWYPVLCLL